MSFLWVNGTLIPSTEKALAGNDRGALYGDGVFETMRLTKGHLPLIDAHMNRLTESCAFLHLRLPPLRSLRAGIESTLIANQVRDGAVRLTVTRGVGPRGLLAQRDHVPTVMIAVTALLSAPEPARLHISRYRRDGASPLSRLKTLNYLPEIMARLEAEQNGYNDALLLGRDGLHIADTTAATLVVLSDGAGGGYRADGAYVTPPLCDGALEGISRDRLLASGLCQEKRLTTETLMHAHAAWLVNSLSVRPVQQVETHRLAELPSATALLKSCVHPSV